MGNKIKTISFAILSVPAIYSFITFIKSISTYLEWKDFTIIDKYILLVANALVQIKFSLVLFFATILFAVIMFALAEIVDLLQEISQNSKIQIEKQNQIIDLKLTEN